MSVLTDREEVAQKLEKRLALTSSQRDLARGEAAERKAECSRLEKALDAARATATTKPRAKRVFQLSDDEEEMEGWDHDKEESFERRKKASRTT